MADKWTWNPKHLGTQQAEYGVHENEVWIYLRGRSLEIVVQTNIGGKVLGTTTWKVRLPVQRGPNAKAADRLRRKLGERRDADTTETNNA